jgi:DNA repair/transcription protein MET18/MMS19
VGRFALSQVLPQLFRQYHTESEIPHRGPILSVIADLLKALVDAYTAEGTTRSHAKEKSIEMYRDELLSLLSSGMESPSLAMKTAGLEGAVNLCHVWGFLTGEEVAFLVQKMDDLLLQLDFQDLRCVSLLISRCDLTGVGFRKSALEGLVSISKLTSKPIEEITLPLLFGKLPDTAPPLDDESKRLEYKQILSSVSVLCTLPGLLEMMILRILARLETLASAEDDATTTESGTTEDASVRRECNAAYANALLRSLLSTIRRKVQDGHRDIAKHFDTLVPRLFDFFVSGSTSGTGNAIKTDVRLLSAAASIIETITQTLPKE